jgi:hypothetical protein
MLTVLRISWLQLLLYFAYLGVQVFESLWQPAAGQRIQMLPDASRCFQMFPDEAIN